MATAAASRSDFESGSLPKICVKTGVPTESSAVVRISSAPPWTWVLILVGIIPFLIVRWLASKTAVGRVPVSPAALRRVQTSRWTLAGIFVVGAGLIVASTAAGPALMWIGLALVVLSLVLMTGARPVWWIGGQLKDDWVWLRGVHPIFARALGERYHSLPAEQRPV